MPENRAGQHRPLRQEFLQEPQARPMGAGRDLSGRRKDGSEFPVEIGLNPVVRNARNAVLATVIDTSERRRLQDRQQFLIRELKHRTSNLLAVIQSIAIRTFADGEPIASARQAFIARLTALAGAHGMLADAAWEGAPLSEVLKRELASFSDHVTISGCELVINPPAAQQFALIIHELATNAAKHGAWSAPGGQVSVEGRIERNGSDASFLFLWKETGGPGVSAPWRKGFGSTILIDAAGQFGQNVTVNYEPEGLSYELLVSLSAIQAGAQAATAPDARAG